MADIKVAKAIARNAYKAGYAQMALYNILKELGVEFEATEEDDEISNI